MISEKYDIDLDLNKMKKLGAALAHPPITTIGNDLLSSCYDAQDDLQKLARLLSAASEHCSISVPKLKHLSQSLTEIQTTVFNVTEKKLNAYKSTYPDSPLFSVATLLGTIEYGRQETAITRAIAWLIDEKQSHGFGCGIAQLILNLVASTEPEKTVSSVTLAIPERATRKGQRIDVWAEGTWNNDSHWTIFIEAKFYASESLDQLSSYEDEKPESGEWIGIFLTPDGSSPKTAGHNRWEVLSIEKLAKALASYYLKVREKDGADFLRLFTAGLLRDVLECPVPITALKNNRFDIAGLVSIK